MQCTYLSPQIQNELIDILGNDIILTSIINEIKEAKFYAILVDEATSHNVEQMTLYIQFVDKNRDIREESLKFEALDHPV